MKIIKQRGFTLVEIIIAMGLGVFLLGSMTILFINSSIMNKTQQNVSKIQDDSVFSFLLLENDIALTGFRGCSSGLVNPSSGFKFSNNAGTANYFNSTNFIQGSQGMGTTFNPGLDGAISGLKPSPNPKMDIVTIRSASSDPAIVTTDMTSTSSKILLTSSENFVNNGYAIISNCYSGSLMKVSNLALGTITPTTALNIAYNTGSQIYPYNTITYYVGTDNTLYKTSNGGTPTAIAYNVEKFSIFYGIDTDADNNVNRYTFAPNVSNFEQVVAIRIGIVMKSNDINTIGSSKETYSYQFNGRKYTPQDGKLRKIYYTTITLRNMLL